MSYTEEGLSVHHTEPQAHPDPPGEHEANQAAAQQNSAGNTAHPFDMFEPRDGEPVVSDRKITPMERFRLWREVGRLSREYNETVGSGMSVGITPGLDPEDAGKFSPIDPDRIRTIRISLKRDVNDANRVANRAAQTNTRIPGVANALTDARDVRSRVRDFAETSHARLPLQQRVAANKIN